jgi:hypothetical protein
MSVTYAYGDEWAAATPAQLPPPAAPKKQQQNPLAGCAVLIVAASALIWLANRGTSPGATSGPAHSTATPEVGVFGVMEYVVDFYEFDLDLIGDYNDQGSWYSEVDEDRGISGDILMRKGMVDEVELSTAVGVDLVGSSQAC